MFCHASNYSAIIYSIYIDENVLTFGLLNFYASTEFTCGIRLRSVLIFYIVLQLLSFHQMKVLQKVDYSSKMFSSENISVFCFTNLVQIKSIREILQCDRNHRTLLMHSATVVINRTGGFKMCELDLICFFMKIQEGQRMLASGWSKICIFFHRWGLISLHNFMSFSQIV